MRRLDRSGRVIPVVQRAVLSARLAPGVVCFEQALQAFTQLGNL